MAGDIGVTNGRRPIRSKAFREEFDGDKAFEAAADTTEGRREIADKKRARNNSFVFLFVVSFFLFDQTRIRS